MTIQQWVRRHMGKDPDHDQTFVLIWTWDHQNRVMAPRIVTDQIGIEVGLDWLKRKLPATFAERKMEIHPGLIGQQEVNQHEEFIR